MIAPKKVDLSAAENIVDDLIHRFGLPLVKTVLTDVKISKRAVESIHACYITKDTQPPNILILGKDAVERDIILLGTLYGKEFRLDVGMLLEEGERCALTTLASFTFSTACHALLTRYIPTIAALIPYCPYYTSPYSAQLKVTFKWLEGEKDTIPFDLELVRNSKLVVTPSDWNAFVAKALNTYNSRTQGIEFLSFDDAFALMEKIKKRYGLFDMGAPKELTKPTYIPVLGEMHPHVIYRPIYDLTKDYATFDFGYVEYGMGRCPAFRVSTLRRLHKLLSEHMLFPLLRPHLTSALFFADVVNRVSNTCFLLVKAGATDLVVSSKSSMYKIRILSGGKIISPKRWRNWVTNLRVNLLYDAV